MRENYERKRKRSSAQGRKDSSAQGLKQPVLKLG